MNKRGGFYLLGICVGGFLLSLVVNKFAAVYRVEQHSMENTLFNGDKMLVLRSKNIKRRNIVVFKHDGGTFVKRCIAVGGDTVEIKSGNIFTNNELSQISTIKDNNKENHDKDIMILNYYGMSWTLKDFGPVIVPHKGLTIKMNERNRVIYAKTIQKESADRKLTIELAEDSSYTFLDDYIFVIGDNRMHSDDSRIFGFVPVDQIVGKTDLVLYSISDFSRILGTVN